MIKKQALLLSVLLAFGVAVAPVYAGDMGPGDKQAKCEAKAKKKYKSQKKQEAYIKKCLAAKPKEKK